ncbi:MAG: lipid-A-disaccharide synthase [Candidatus Omnitrophota bacterium]
MAQINHIFIICGEPSGDLNAANLAKAILQINPRIKISGVGGEQLRQAGATIYRDIKGLSVIGFFDVLKKLPVFLSLKELILGKIKTERPDAIILVDFSGFNLRLARKINKTIPVIYYVSPQVWASRPGRVKTIKEYVDKMVVLFKFEEEFYKRRGVNAEFAGHPLLDVVRPAMETDKFLRKFNLREPKATFALLPGSRKQEIKNILPVMLETASLIKRKIGDARFVIAKSPQVDIDIYNSVIGDTDIDLTIIEGKTYDCLNIADFCLVASGTATLETAIMQKPFALIYKMNLLNYLLYRPQVKVPYIGIVNIVAGKRIVPEFIQFEACPREIAKRALGIMQNPAELQQMKDNLAIVKSLLGENGASLRAAQIILDFLEKSC